MSLNAKNAKKVVKNIISLAVNFLSNTEKMLEGKKNIKPDFFCFYLSKYLLGLNKKEKIKMKMNRVSETVTYN